MRHFISYGPVDAEEHFCVTRSILVDQCANQLVGHETKGGHYFTIYAPRQAGKTWLMRQAVEEVRRRHGDRFLLATLSFQGLMEQDDSDEVFLQRVGQRLAEGVFDYEPSFADWPDWLRLFHRTAGAFDRPLILLIDEFDSLSKKTLDRVVSLFRQMYLQRESYYLHGLALVGVRAVLGVDSPRGSPFNIQRSLHVPNFTPEEVRELFRQYQEESGQEVLPEVVEEVYDAVRGQPGLTGWFGELLTEKYNPEPSRPIDLARWRSVYARALFSERNNNVLNLIAKARSPYAREVQRLFVRSDVPFSVRQPWCDYLELNGVITEKILIKDGGREAFVCQFASPFVQRCLYEAFSEELQSASSDVPVLEGTDTLEDVFVASGGEPGRLDVVALLGRYKQYLEDLRAQDRDPFRDQPMRADSQLREAVGHFHLYAWLLQAVGRLCTITPEFPTGNGKVDLRLLYGDQPALVEVKSLGAAWELPRDRLQAAEYAKKLKLSEVTLALFVPTKRPEAVGKLEGTTEVEGVRVHVVAVSWRP